MPWHPSPDASSSSSRPARRRRIGEVKLEDEEALFLSSAPPTPALTDPLTLNDALTSTDQQALTNPADISTFVSKSKVRYDQLVPEQVKAIELIASGRNIFLAGGAGSGKTIVLEFAIAQLRNIGKRVRVSSPTGMAAHGAGGITIHSLFGLGPNSSRDPLWKLEERAQSGSLRARLAGTDVLIIDEISMVENIFFERLNRIMRAAKDVNGPFGDTQVVVCGDFRQLPPVKPFDSCFSCGGLTIKRVKNQIAVSICRCGGEEDQSRQWAFFSMTWSDLEFVNIKLEQIHRQEERHFISILNKVGDGIPLTEAEGDLVLAHECDAEGGLKLLAKRADVNAENAREFAKLPTKQVNYNCLDTFDMRPRHSREYGDFKTLSWDRKTLRELHSHPYEELLKLKEDEEVLLTVNLNVEKGLVNGSRGKIIRFESCDATEIPRSTSGIDHLQAAAEGEGQQMTGYSRSVRGNENNALRTEQAKAFLTETNRGVELPVVRFKNGMEVKIWPDCSVTQIGDDEPYSYLCRTQIPLVAGYAVTIHKAQGMTVDRLIVDISGIFAAGMVYVALSRVKTLYGLQVFGPKSALDKYGANPEVMKFLRETTWH